MSNTQISKVRSSITDYIVKYLAMMEPEKTNANRYKKFLETMTNNEFEVFMQYLEEKKFHIRMYIPNMKITLKLQNLLNTAKALNLPLFERIEMYDSTTGYRYLTNQKYLTIRIPVRRVVQYLQHKMSMPTSDTDIESLTGQVVGEDKAASITAVETQILHSKGLDEVLIELLKVRGGDIGAYQELKQQVANSGEVSLTDLGQNTRVKSVVVFSTYLKAMHIDNNYAE